jgi:hypothetical protein
LRKLLATSRLTCNKTQQFQRLVLSDQIEPQALSFRAASFENTRGTAKSQEQTKQVPQNCFLAYLNGYI